MPLARRPSYSRLSVDERRDQLIAAGSALFAEYAYEEISMAQIARTAGVSKPLLYHYFPSKIDLFKAAVAQHAAELQRRLEPTGEGNAFEQLTATLDGYLAWIDDNRQTWTKLMQSATTLPQAHELVETFRESTLRQILTRLTDRPTPPPALRIALRGWLGYVDAAILAWSETQDISRTQLRDLIVASFGASLFAAQQAEPSLEFDFDS